MKVLVFAASLRKASLNRKLAAVAADLLGGDSSLQIDHADYRDFEMPPYDGDLEEAKGLPSGSREFINRIQQASAIVIST
ncbi:MAG: NAD(P)H-dependent oxidoreductase, partial [Bdellovibrionaceae bacterium]|nr:NAD(P)H-dependent oxidoreductase [Pseudobdellovibrionaceae bacterium]